MGGAMAVEGFRLEELCFEEVIACVRDARAEYLKVFRGWGRREEGVGAQGERWAWIEAIEGFKGRDSQGRVRGGVVGELRGEEVFIPGFVEGVEVVFERVEERAVSPFREPLRFRMVGGRDAKLGAAELEEVCPEGACEDRPAVGVDRFRKSMVPENVEKENLSKILGCETFDVVASNRNGTPRAGEVVSEGDNKVISIARHRKGTKEVDANGCPR
jgi:hypothetical protein